MKQKRICTEKSTSFLEKLVVTVLALCPILQHYKGIFVNASVTLLLLMFPYVVLKLLHVGSIKMKRLTLVFPLMLTFLYEVASHGTSVTEAGQAVVFIVYFTAVAAGCLDTKHFVRAVTGVSVIASILIIVQYVCYYILGFHLQLVPTDLLLDKSEQWVLLAQTGRVSVTGKVISFYRPSSFFLEPSHMFIYTFTPLLITLLSPDFGKKQFCIAALLTVGMVFSTSGMGIASAAGAWVLFLGKNGGKSSRLDIRKFFRPRSVLIFLILVVGVIALFIWVPFFQRSVLRVFSSGMDYKNAVSGRVAGGAKVLSGLSTTQLIFGVADNTVGVTAPMTGFSEEMYKHGIIGTAISYLFYIQGLLRLKDQYFWVCFLAIVMSFFSQHSHSSFFMLYCAFTFTEGFRQNQLHASEVPRPAEAVHLSRCQH